MIPPPGQTPFASPGGRLTAPLVMPGTVQLIATTGTINDQAIATGATVLRFTGSGTRFLTGISATGVKDQQLLLIEEASGNGSALVLSWFSPLSGINNRFFANVSAAAGFSSANRGGIVIPPNGYVWLIYDAANAWWRAISELPLDPLDRQKGAHRLALTWDPTLVDAWFWDCVGNSKVVTLVAAGGTLTFPGAFRGAARLSTSAGAGGAVVVCSGDTVNRVALLTNLRTDAWYVQVRVNIPVFDANTVVRVGFYDATAANFFAFETRGAARDVGFNNNGTFTSFGGPVFPDSVNFHDMGFRSDGTTVTAMMNGADVATASAVAIAAGIGVGVGAAAGIQINNNGVAVNEVVNVGDMFCATRQP